MLYPNNAECLANYQYLSGWFDSTRVRSGGFESHDLPNHPMHPDHLSVLFGPPHPVDGDALVGWELFAHPTVWT